MEKHINDEKLSGSSSPVAGGHEQLEEAQKAMEKEHRMPLKLAVRTYWKAILWSVCLSSAVIMEGYDTILMGSLLAYPSFINQFANTATADGERQISAPWQAALVNGAYIGEVLGLWMTGLACDRFGNKKTMFVALVALEAFSFLSVLGMNLPTQLAGQILCGLPWGTFQTLSTVYASEVLPMHLRGYLTSYVNLCWTIGQLLASGILVAFTDRLDNLGWQIPFAVQFAWPIPIFLACIFCPESPTWLVKNGQLAEAEHSVRRLTNYNAADALGARAEIPGPEETVALLVATDKAERAVMDGARYIDCFKGTNLRRTEIACVTWAAQELPGIVLLSYATTFFVQAGLPTEQAFNLNVGLYALGFVGTILSWPLIRYFGRRTIFLWGQVLLFVILLAIGGVGCAEQTTTTAWITGALLLALTFFYDITLGPVTYAIVPEMPSSRLRIKTVVLARNVYNVACIVVGVLAPYQLNPTSWNWGAKSGFFWAGAAFLCIVWTYFRLPETKDRTFYELDNLFENRVPARKFKSTQAVDS